MISAFYHCGIPLILLHRDETFKEIPLYRVFCFLCEVVIDGEWFKIFLYLSLLKTREFWASGLDHGLTTTIHRRFLPNWFVNWRQNGGIHGKFGWCFCLLYLFLTRMIDYWTKSHNFYGARKPNLYLMPDGSYLLWFLIMHVYFLQTEGNKLTLCWLKSRSFSSSCLLNEM